MRRIWIGTMVLAWSALGASLAAAQEPEGVRRTDAGVVLDFQDADLRVVIGALAELAGLNVLYANLPPNRTVTLRTPGPVSTDVVRRYLESVVASHGLEMVEEGPLIRIQGAAAAAPGPAAPAAPARTPSLEKASGAEDVPRLYVHRLRHAQADALAETLAALFGGATAGDVGPDEEDGARSLSEALQAQQEMRLANAVAADAGRATGIGDAAGLAAGLVGPVQIVPDLRSNALLIRALPVDYATIRAAIEELDTRPLQVLIDVLIAEVRRSDERGLGVSIDVPPQRDSETGALIDGSLAGASAGDVLLRFREFGAAGADVVLRALASSSDVTILSRPLVLAENNQRARILVGDQRPFIQLFRALPTDAAIRDQIVQYRNVGTQLTIRPTINPDGFISMELLQEVSTATAETQFGAPVISTREAETRLLVRDGHTVVIGGLIDEQEDRTESGIPILKDIPILGALFRSSRTRRIRTELFLILTPYVIRTDEELEETTRELQERTEVLRDRLPVPVPMLPPDTTSQDSTASPVSTASPDTVPAPPPARSGARGRGGRGGR
ncbi:MAG TPA: secretin N-terminal domain-containing protein [Longimicrobiales bacterium]